MRLKCYIVEVKYGMHKFEIYDLMIDSVSFYINVTCPKVSLTKNEYFYENGLLENIHQFFIVFKKLCQYTKRRIARALKLLQMS